MHALILNHKSKVYSLCYYEISTLSQWYFKEENPLNSYYFLGKTGTSPVYVTLFGSSAFLFAASASFFLSYGLLLIIEA